MTTAMLPPTIALGAAAVLFSALVKGAIAFGFPTIATPLLALFIDVKLAVAVLVLPNIVMDGIQLRRVGGVPGTVRRLGVVIFFGIVGTVLGTKLLVLMPARVATLVLGIFVLVFVALNSTRFSPRVPASWEPWLAAPVGIATGVVGGVTNVPGAALVIYFYALGMAKPEFLRAVALSFVTYKVVQFVSLVYYGVITWRVMPASAGVTVIALGGFWLGLKIQDRLDQVTFNRAVLVFLAALGVWLTVRAIR